MVLLFMKTRFFRAHYGAVAAFGALIFSASVSAQDGAGTVALAEVVVTARRFCAARYSYPYLVLYNIYI